jgi:predicted RNA methylase
VKINKIFDNLTIRGNCAILDDSEFAIIKGKHSIWIPEKEMKIPWAYNGKITPFSSTIDDEILSRNWNSDNRYWENESLRSICNEFLIFRELNERNLTVGIRGIFFIKNVISNFMGDFEICDSKGMYGYFMEDANRENSKGHFRFDELPNKRGYYDVDYLPRRFERLIEPKLNISNGAKGDLRKSENIINGFLIDIRRSMFDMMILKSMEKGIEEKIMYKEDKEELKKKIEKLTQFPHKERKHNYQSYFIDDEEVSGSRDTQTRMNEMGIQEDLTGKAILDLGCNLGSICCECWKRGARLVMGLDNETDYIDCARDLARYNGFNINYMVKDITNVDDITRYINGFFGSKSIDIVFALSLYKHVKEKMFEVLDRIKWQEIIIESNNAPKGEETLHCKEIIDQINKRGWKRVLLGYDKTRSKRCIWKVTR